MKRTLILTGSLLLAALTLTALALGGPDAVPAAAVGESPAASAARALEADGAPVERPARTTVVGDAACSYHLTSGTCLRFRWTSRTETTLGAVEGGAAGGPVPEVGPVFALGGVLMVTGLGTRGDDLLVELRFADLRVDALGADTAAAARAAATLRADLEAGTLVRIARDGRIRGYGFADGLQPESRNWLRTVANACRVALGAGGEEAWTREESDETGVVLCEQRWTTAPLGERRAWSRKKVRYLDQTEKTPRPRLDATAEGVFDLVLGWPSRVAGRQRAELEVPAIGLRVDSRFTFSCELAEAVTGTGTMCPDRPTDAPLTGAADCASAHATTRAADFRALLEGIPTDELIRRLLELARGDLASPELLAGRENLVWALKLWPERVAEVLRTVKAGGLEDQGLMVLLSALGAAQHETAQKALVECCAEGEGEKTRVFALRALFQVEKAAAATVDAARAAVRGTGNDLVATTAMLLLGRFADGDGSQVKALLAQEAEAVSGQRVGSWLLALGNAHSVDALPVVQRHAASADAGVRAAAIDALGVLPGDAALKALAAHTVQETEPELRAHAAETLAAREERASLHLVDELLERESDPDVRTAALRPLARKLPDAEARRLLERSASADGDPRVRKFAAESLRR